MTEPVPAISNFHDEDQLFPDMKYLHSHLSTESLLMEQSILHSKLTQNPTEPSLLANYTTFLKSVVWHRSAPQIYESALRFNPVLARRIIFNHEVSPSDSSLAPPARKRDTIRRLISQLMPFGGGGGGVNRRPESGDRVALLQGDVDRLRREARRCAQLAERSEARAFC